MGNKATVSPVKVEVWQAVHPEFLRHMLELVRLNIYLQEMNLQIHTVHTESSFSRMQQGVRIPLCEQEAAV